jgi:hypothetical protein
MSARSWQVNGFLGERASGPYSPLLRAAQQLYRSFPGELGLFAAEVAVGGGLAVDGAQQVQHLDDALGAQVEVGFHQLGDFVVGDHARAFGVDRDVHRACHANRIGHLDLALARQAGGHDVLGHVAGGVGGRAVHLGWVLAAEGAAAVGAGAAVGVHDDLAAGEAAVALRAADDEAARGVDQVLGVLQPFLGQHGLDDFFDDRLDEAGLHLGGVSLWSGLCWVESTTVSMLWGLPST